MNARSLTSISKTRRDAGWLCIALQGTRHANQALNLKYKNGDRSPILNPNNLTPVINSWSSLADEQALAFVVNEDERG
jgi:hypothetical protein